MRKVVFKIILINVSVLVGCVLAAYLLPAQTSVPGFLLICLLAFIVFNVLLFAPRFRPTSESDPKPKWPARKIIAWIVILLCLVLEFFRRYGAAHHGK